jgi:hypothetical protein
MHVEDNNNIEEVIGLRIIDSNGDQYCVEVTNDLIISKLKTMCLIHFLNDPLVSIKIQQQFKLVSIHKNKSLNEDSSLKDEDINDGMVLLLLPRISVKRRPEESLENEMKNKTPTEDDIMGATKDLISKNLDRNNIEISNTIDV